MVLFLLIGILTGIGIALGIRNNRKGLVRASFIVLIMDITVFIVGTILYAFFA